MAKRMPWTFYWRRLDRLNELISDVLPLPEYGSKDFCEWIGKFTFLELWTADYVCERLALDLVQREALPADVDFGWHGVEIRWQMAFRFECAIDFCAGRVEKRKDFDWTQEPSKVFESLLINFWRRSAMYWASRKYGRNPESSLAEMIERRFSTINPTHN